MMSDIADIIALSLKTSDGRGGINSNAIRCLTKKHIFIPTSMNELEHHLNHGLHILNVILGIKSFIVTQISGCLKHIKHNQSIYCKMLCINNLFATQILFVIDVRAQNFSREVQQDIFSTVPLNLSTMY